MQHDFETLTREALTVPGKLSEAYSAFWEYSMGNQMLAMMQLGKPEPINTFPGWKAIGRHVKKGAKAIELIMPVFKKAKEEVTEPKQTGSVYFIARRNWFGISSTEGEDYKPIPIPDFDRERVLTTLNITQQRFETISGNCMGYARTDERIISVSPIAFDPLKTFFHETAHVLLHPGATSLDGERLERSVKEVEAELTAYLVKATLGFSEGLELSRGYIQNWINDTTLEKVRFSKVYGAADAILKAGRPAPSAPEPSQVVPG